MTKRGKRRPSVVDEDAPLYDVKVKHLSLLPTTITVLTGWMHHNAPTLPFICYFLAFVQAIIPAIRQMTFAGFRIVFSSVIPLDVPPETTDIWRTAVAFGAECYKELNPRITHVVANKVGLSSRPCSDLEWD